MILDSFQPEKKSRVFSNLKIKGRIAQNGREIEDEFTCKSVEQELEDFIKLKDKIWYCSYLRLGELYEVTDLGNGF